MHTDRQGLLEFHAGVFVLAVHTQRLCNSKIMEFQATAFGHSEAALKFVFSEKATKNDESFTDNFTLTT